MRKTTLLGRMKTVTGKKTVSNAQKNSKNIILPDMQHQTNPITELVIRKIEVIKLRQNIKVLRTQLMLTNKTKTE